MIFDNFPYHIFGSILFYYDNIQEPAGADPRDVGIPKECCPEEGTWPERSIWPKVFIPDSKKCHNLLHCTFKIFYWASVLLLLKIFTLDFFPYRNLFRSIYGGIFRRWDRDPKKLLQKSKQEKTLWKYKIGILSITLENKVFILQFGTITWLIEINPGNKNYCFPNSSVNGQCLTYKKKIYQKRNWIFGRKPMAILVLECAD